MFNATKDANSKFAHGLKTSKQLRRILKLKKYEIILWKNLSRLQFCGNDTTQSLMCLS